MGEKVGWLLSVRGFALQRQAEKRKWFFWLTTTNVLAHCTTRFFLLSSAYSSGCSQLSYRPRRRAIIICLFFGEWPRAIFMMLYAPNGFNRSNHPSNWTAAAVTSLANSGFVQISMGAHLYIQNFGNGPRQYLACIMHQIRMRNKGLCTELIRAI